MQERIREILQQQMPMRGQGLTYGGERGPNKWVQYLKCLEKKTKIPYNELMVNPQVKKDYHATGGAIVGGAPKKGKYYKNVADSILARFGKEAKAKYMADREGVPGRKRKATVKKAPVKKRTVTATAKAPARLTMKQLMACSKFTKKAPAKKRTVTRRAPIRRTLRVRDLFADPNMSRARCMNERGNCYLQKGQLSAKLQKCAEKMEKLEKEIQSISKKAPKKKQTLSSDNYIETYGNNDDFMSSMINSVPGENPRSSLTRLIDDLTLASTRVPTLSSTIMSTSTSGPMPTSSPKYTLAQLGKMNRDELIKEIYRVRRNEAIEYAKNYNEPIENLDIKYLRNFLKYGQTASYRVGQY
jgi:hypothetical protein